VKVTLVHFSPRLLGETLGKIQAILDGINGSKKVARTWKMMKTLLITFFDIKGTFHFEFIPQTKHSTNLIIWKY